MNVCIIYGGKSGEHQVSKVSALSVFKNLDKTKHNAVLIGITKKGEWYLQPQDEKLISQNGNYLTIREIPENRVNIIPGGRENAFRIQEKALSTDVIFPVLHGTYGEDGTIQGLFEMAQIPYIGGGVLSSSIAMDKEKTKIIWENAGLPVVPYIAVKDYQWENPEEQQKIIARAEYSLRYPVFVKPACAGSSVGAGRAENRQELLLKASEAFQWDSKILLETSINAREIECSVTGNKVFTAYTPGEIAPTHDFYDYEAKYLDPKGAALKIPADIDDSMMYRIRETAVKAYEALDMTGLSRVDFFIDKNDGRLYLNEINTLPGFTSISMFPKMCEASGLPYALLLEELIKLAIDRFENKKQLKLENLE